jgi:hypothetical protein
MFPRRTLPVSIGIILFSGMFLMVQETWAEDSCEQALTMFNSQTCKDLAYANIETLKSCLALCVCDTPCADVCWESWHIAVSPPECTLSDGSSAAQKLASGDCGSCYPACFVPFDQCPGGCVYDPGKTGTDCLDAVFACVNACPVNGIWETTNAEAATYGRNSLTGSGVFNELYLILVPLGTVICLRILRRSR